MGLMGWLLLCNKSPSICGLQWHTFIISRHLWARSLGGVAESSAQGLTWSEQAAGGLRSHLWHDRGRISCSADLTCCGFSSLWL